MRKQLTACISLLLLSFFLLTGCQSLGIYPKGPHFERTGDMHYARAYHTATLLNNGTVLIAGGMCDPQHPPAEGDYTGVSGCLLLTAEIYDPKQGKFTVIPDRMKEAHYMWGGIAPKLSDGRVVFIGEPGEHAEIYDPKTKTFSLSQGRIITPRREHTLAVLKDDRILIVGGLGKDTFTPPSYSKHLNSAEIFDPVTGHFSLTGKTDAPLSRLKSVLCSNGEVLIVGNSGLLNKNLTSKSIEIYNPITQQFRKLLIPTLTRSDGEIFSLPNGNVFIVAGSGYMFKPIPAEMFDSSTQQIVVQKHIGPTHLRPATALLPDGKMLIAGGIQQGFGTSSILKTAETYAPVTDTYTQLPDMMEKRADGTATPLINGDILITGGAVNDRPTKSAEIFKSK